MFQECSPEPLQKMFKENCKCRKQKMLTSTSCTYSFVLCKFFRELLCSGTSLGWNIWLRHFYLFRIAHYHRFIIYKYIASKNSSYLLLISFLEVCECKTVNENTPTDGQYDQQKFLLDIHLFKCFHSGIHFQLRSLSLLLKNGYFDLL